MLARAAARVARPALTGAGLAAATGLAAYSYNSGLGTAMCQSTKEDRGRTAGVFDGGLGFGKKSAIVVVDFVNAYVEPSSLLYCGDAGWGVVPAVEASKPLLELARAKGVDVIFTKVLYHKHGKDGGVFAMKVPLLRTFTEDNPLTEIVPEMQVCQTCPVGASAHVSVASHANETFTWLICRRQVSEEGGDTVIVKKYPSAFFGTELASMLAARGVDTIILLGCR